MNYYRRVMSDVQNKVRREAQETQAARIGKVSEVHSGQKYTLEFPDGRSLRYVPNARPGALFVEGQWVVIELVKGSWYIVGLAPQRAD